MNPGCMSSRKETSGKPTDDCESVACQHEVGPETGMWEITPDKSASVY